MNKNLTLIILVALALGASAAGVPGAPVPSPSPSPTVSAIASTGPILRFAGQILDYEHAFLFFTTGDGYRVSPTVQIIDAQTGSATTKIPRTRMYARATFDSQGTVTEIALSDHPLKDEATYAQVRQYAIAQSVRQPNPDFKPGAAGIEGKPVLVTFEVQVPANTPLSDQVYFSTDKSGWLPNAVRMDRVDALHYKYTVRLNSGTDLHYLYTRGTWTTVERAQNGLEERPRHIFVTNLDVKNRADQVYYWADQMTSGPASSQAQFNPGVLPTPFNSSPFGNLPKPGGPYGSPGPFPTPHA